MHILRKKRDMHFIMIPVMPTLEGAQIVPVKVKYFQIVSNETKITLKTRIRTKEQAEASAEVRL
jgi:hypothetical protein